MTIMQTPGRLGFLEDTERDKRCTSKHYNYYLRKSDGLFARWGEKKEDDPEWSLDRSVTDGAGVSDRPTIECPKCQAIYRGGKCRNCGYEPSKKERKGQGLDFNDDAMTRFHEDGHRCAIDVENERFIVVMVDFV